MLVSTSRKEDHEMTAPPSAAADAGPARPNRRFAGLMPAVLIGLPLAGGFIDLADADAEGLETSYGLVKIITWAIPILGFLGTVLGITKAIAGVNPEVLEKNLNSVTDGLAEAFDTTASALALTMVVMFFSFVV